MPFRKNLFQERIAQPETDLAEIEQFFNENFGAETVAIWSADLFLEDDATFKFGGTLYLTLDVIDDDDGNFAKEERQMEFDGFASLDDCRAFLASLGSFDINEVE